MYKVIYPKPPFDFSKMLIRLLSTGKNEISLINLDELSYKRIVWIENKKVLLHVSFEGTIEEPKLLVHLTNGLSDDEIEKLTKLVRFVFSVDLDLMGFYQHFPNSHPMHNIIERFYGFRLILEPDLFESIIKTIIGQQLNLSFASTLINRFTSSFGELVNHEGIEFSVFPTPEKVANLSYEQLREISFSQRKSEYVIDFARLVVEGKIKLHELHKMSDEKITATLLPLRGIGKWTIECFLIFALGRPNCLPTADIGLRNAVKKAWNLPHQPTEADINIMALDWSPWRSCASYYLWESINQA